MADCSCDFCGQNEKCKHAYEESDCRVAEILSAKVIADEEFKSFCEKMKKLNKIMNNDSLEQIIHTMQNIICDAGLEETTYCDACGEVFIPEITLNEEEYSLHAVCPKCKKNNRILEI
jgi:hypothetical protein